MNKAELTVYPDIYEFAEGSKLDSAQYNKNFNSIEESILRAILSGRDIKNYTEKLQKGSIASYAALSSAISKMSDPSAGGYVISAHDAQIYSNTSHIKIDNIYGNITTGIQKSFSKIARVNGVVNPNLKVNLKSYDNADVLIADANFNSNDTDIYDIFDGKLETFWIHDQTTEAYYVMQIDLPPTLTNRFNMIQIDPYPLYGIIIEDIMYYDQYGTYNELSGNKTFVGYDPIKSHDGSPLKIYTSPIETSGTVFIKFRPIGDINVIGFSNIDFRFVDFITTSVSSTTGDVQNPLSNEPIFEIQDSLNKSLSTKNIKITNINIKGYHHNMGNSSLKSLSDLNMVSVYIAVAETIDEATIFTQIPIREFDFDWNHTISIPSGQKIFFKLKLLTNNLAAGVIKRIKINYMEE